MTPGIRRTRSFPYEETCGADLFGAALDNPAAASCEKVSGWELLLFSDNSWVIERSPLECMVRWKKLDFDLHDRRQHGCSAADSLEAAIVTS